MRTLVFVLSLSPVGHVSPDRPRCRQSRGHPSISVKYPCSNPLVQFPRQGRLEDLPRMSRRRRQLTYPNVIRKPRTMMLWLAKNKVLTSRASHSPRFCKASSGPLSSTPRTLKPSGCTWSRMLLQPSCSQTLPSFQTLTLGTPFRARRFMRPTKARANG